MVMALFDRCLCCTILTGTILTAIYSTVAYIVAFAFEIWLITEAGDEAATPSYILCGGFFIVWLASVGLLVGLALHRTRPILTWLLTSILCFFPECGLVLFMSIYYWSLSTSYGKAELIFWVFRAACNIMGVICVHCHYSNWKDEKNVSRRLRDLTLTGIVTKGTLPDVDNKAFSQLRGYQNEGYMKSNLHITQSNSNHENNAGPTSLNSSSLKRSLSSASLYGDRSERQIVPTMYRKSQEDTAALYDMLASRRLQAYAYNNPSYPYIMDPSLVYGSMGIAGVGLYPEKVVGGSIRQIARYRAQSLVYLDDPDAYWSRPPLSRPVSVGLINQPRLSDTNNWADPNRSNALAGGMRRAQSLSAICQPSHANGDVTLQKLAREPFSYLSNGSKRSLGTESDDLGRYKDIAL